LFLLGKLLSKDRQLPSLSAQELEDMKNLYARSDFPSQTICNAGCMYRRLHELAAFAEQKRVRLMIDAEQTYVSCFHLCIYVTFRFPRCTHSEYFLLHHVDAFCAVTCSPLLTTAFTSYNAA
jgi:hypothetical protein